MAALVNGCNVFFSNSIFNIDNLQTLLQNEEDHDEFAKVPFHYMEIAHMLLDV